MSYIKQLPGAVKWEPRPYQVRAVRFLEENGAAALFLDPGLGKTSIVLTAFEKMRKQGVARRMLVIAPLRVCQLVWRQEVEKWEHTRHLKVAVLHGKHKDKLFDEDADIHVINREGIDWLVSKCGGALPYDTVVIDELTKFKNAQGSRFKKLRGGKVGQRTYPNLLARVARRWGLTGTPTPNGYLDLFGQMLILDDGATFGKYITHFRDTYFIPSFNGFDYNLQPGAEKRIQARLERIALRMSAEEFLELPPTVDHIIDVELDAKGWKSYRAMKDTMILPLTGDTVTAANVAVVQMLLEQLANGAIYLPAEEGKPRRWEEVHSAKLDALEELVAELDGQPLIVAYQFKHDLARIKARLGDVPVLTGNDTQIAALEAAWNRNEIPVLLCHPDSVGHGLNLQGGNACHIAWFSPTWNYENYEQLIGRLRRSGNEAERIMNHIIAVRGTVDFLKIEALKDKGTEQTVLLRGLTGILHATEQNYDIGLLTSEEKDMAIRKLTRPGAEAPATEERPRPAGWGQRAAPRAEDPPEPEEEGDEPEAPPLFSSRVAAALADEPATDESVEVEEKPKRTRARRSEPLQSATVGVVQPAAEDGPPGAVINISIHGTADQIVAALRGLLNP